METEWNSLSKSGQAKWLGRMLNAFTWGCRCILAGEPVPTVRMERCLEALSEFLETLNDVPRAEDTAAQQPAGACDQRESE